MNQICITVNSMSTINKKCVAVKFACYFSALLQEAGNFKTGKNPFCAFLVVLNIGSTVSKFKQPFFLAEKGFQTTILQLIHELNFNLSIFILNLVT